MKLSEALPIKLQKISKVKPLKRKKDGGVGDDFYKHHKYHGDAHISGAPPEHATYDFDDDNYDVEGGYQKRKDGQKRGYEPVKELKDHEGQMAKSQLERSMKYSKMIYKMIQNVDKGKGVEFPAWVQSKLTKAEDYLQSVYNYLDGKDGLEDEFQDEASTTRNVPAYQTPHAFKKSTKVAIDVDDEDDEDEILGGLKDVRKKRVKRFGK